MAGKRIRFFRAGQTLCACGCGASLSGLRADAHYASDSCRKRAQRAKSADKGRTRRQSRDGKGTHVYLTPEEIDFLQNCRVAVRHMADWQSHLSVGRKLAKAKRRLR